MPVPSVDFDNDLVPNNMPSAYLVRKWLLWVRGLVQSVKRLYGIFLGFMNGETFAVYTGAVTYRRGDSVLYNYATWESLQDGNIGNTPQTGSAYWILRNDNFIGVKKRAALTGRYLTLTYYLNEQFGTTFRQPPYPAPYDYGLGGGAWSDIYITNDVPTYTSFVMYPDSIPSSKMYPGTSSGFMFDPPVYASATTYRYVIHIPLSVYAGIDANPTAAEAIVRAFVDAYNPAGIFYRIVTY